MWPDVAFIDGKHIFWRSRRWMRRNQEDQAAVLSDVAKRSLKNWGRNGFDGEMSGLWLHAGPNESVTNIHLCNCEQRTRTGGLISVTLLVWLLTPGESSVMQ